MADREFHRRRDPVPRENLPRGLLFGVIGVVALYLSVNVVALVSSGGRTGAGAGARVGSDAHGAGRNRRDGHALGIAISTLGFLSQGILTSPRVYYAMAGTDCSSGASRRSIRKRTSRSGRSSSRGPSPSSSPCPGPTSRSSATSSPTISSSSAFRRPACSPSGAATGDGPVSLPGAGPSYTTIAFIAVCVAVIATTLYAYPVNSLIGIGILAAACRSITTGGAAPRRAGR